MAREPYSVDDILARTNDYFARLDGRTSEASSARRRYYGRTARSVAKRGVNIGMALIALTVATIGFGLLVGPIGWTGLFVVVVLTMVILAVFAILPMEPKRVAYSEQVPTRTVVQQLESLLVALPDAPNQLAFVDHGASLLRKWRAARLVDYAGGAWGKRRARCCP